MLLGMASLCAGCQQTQRPTVPADVPVQVGIPGAEGTLGDALPPTAEGLPTTPERAQDLVLSEATQMRLPASQASADLWFRLPDAKRARSMQLTLSGGPDARWELRLYRGAYPDAEALRTHQPAPGHPCRVSGIRAAPDLPRIWVRVTRIWQRENIKAISMRLFVEAAVTRPGEEAEPNDTDEDIAPEVPEKGRLEGILSHPGDKDCVSMPALHQEPEDPRDLENPASPAGTPGPQCLKARFHFEGPARRPFLVEGRGANGERLSSRTVRAPTELEMAPGDKDYAVLVCMKMDDGARAPQRWWVEAEPAPCPLPERPPEIEEVPDRHFKVLPDQPTVVSGKLASQDVQHVLVIEAGTTPALIRVEGPVTAHWENPKRKLFVLEPGTEGRLIIQIDAPPAEGDAPFPYWVQLKSLAAGHVLPPQTSPATLADERVYTSVIHGSSAEFILPAHGASTWRVQHLGARKSPPLKIKLLDNEGRPVTSRTILPASEVALKLPAGFGPYRAQFSLAEESTRPVAFALDPGHPPSSPSPETTP